MRKGLVTIIALLSVSSTLAVESDKKKLNVLLITADDLNCNSVGAYGCEIQNITPNIDRLAHEGIQFMNAHVASAVSQPSRGALATGRYPHCSGIEGFYHAEKPQVEIVEVLKEAGSSFEKAVKTTCFLADMADFAAFNAVYEKYIYYSLGLS